MQAVNILMWRIKNKIGYLFASSQQKAYIREGIPPPLQKIPVQNLCLCSIHFSHKRGVEDAAPYEKLSLQKKEGERADNQGFAKDFLPLPEIEHQFDRFGRSRAHPLHTNVERNITFLTPHSSFSQFFDERNG